MRFASTFYILIYFIYQGENFGKFKIKADEAIFVEYVITITYIIYNLRLNIVMEYVHVVFDYKRIQDFEDEGNHDALQF